MEATFKSIKRQGICYDINSKNWDFARGAIHGDVKEYQTYGDGETRHSPAYSSIADNTYDFLVSLAHFLNSNPDKAKELSQAMFWPSHTYRKNIKFYSELKANGKEQYYSINELKTSRAESKRHDKRWEIVPEWADGSFQATFRFLEEKKYGSLERLCLYNELRDFYSEEHDSYCSIEGFGINSTEEWHKMSSALHACQLILSAYRKLDSAQRIIESNLS